MSGNPLEIGKNRNKNFIPKFRESVSRKLSKWYFPVTETLQ